jgi:TolB-like protein
VFDRSEDYDPRIDSIVRVEAQRLRRKLREFYDNAGHEDPVIIEMPARGYVPGFRFARGVVSALQKPAERQLDPLTVAVLPFVYLGPEPDENLLCEGIAEEILNELALAPELKVLAFGSAGIFHGTELDLRDVGGRLGAGTLVRGSVRRAGGRVRISAGAVDARSGEYIWTQSFDRGLEDIFAIQIEIAQAVSLKLRGSTLPMAGGISPASAPTPEAYTAYLRGRREWRQLTIAGCRNAIAEYTSTIARFPDYAQAYASLAIANNWLLFFGAAPLAQTALASRRAAQQALQIDPQNADGHLALAAMVSYIDLNWPEGERLAQRGVALRPGSVSGLTSLAFHCATRGHN